MTISRGFGGTGGRARQLSIALLAALTAFGVAGPASWKPHRAEAAGPNLAQNPGFEDSDDFWTGWTYDGTLKNGDTPAIRLSVDQGGDFVHGGRNSLTYWLDEPFTFRLTQTLTGLQDGTYELAAWAMGGEDSMAGATRLTLFAESGGNREETPIDISAWTEWRRYSLTVQVSGGQAVIGFEVDAPAGQWGYFDDVEFVRADAPSSGPAWDASGSLQASDLMPRSVKLEWSGVRDPADVSHYRIYLDGRLHATVPGDVTAYTVARLAPNTTYRFKVEAGAGGVWTTDGPELTVTTPDGEAAETVFFKGADISTLQAIEDAGGKYYDGGVERDLLDILKDRGVNAIRLRIWHNPVLADGYNDKAHTIGMAKRVKRAGLHLLLDFHYSDFWADPGKQEIPAAWQGLDFAGLRQAVYDYTADVLNALRDEGAYPDLVQVGNEINNGMLLPVGSTGSFDRLADLIGAGIRAVRDTTPPGHDTKIVIHLAEGGDNAKFRSFFDSLTAYTNDFDAIGLSFYPYWHGTYQQLKDNLNDLAVRYGKELIVVETAHPHTLEDGDGWPNIAGAAEAEKNGFPATPEGQKDMLTLMMNLVAHTAGGLGNGVFYWEPAWIPVPRDANGDFRAGWKSKEGNAWDNQAMFDFQGNALPSLDAFRFDPANLPAKTPLRALEPGGVTIPALESQQEAAARLPDRVRVLYNEGSIEDVPVEWPALDEDRLSRIGSFRLTGRTTGPELEVSISVTVTAYRNLVINGGFEDGLTGWSTAGPIKLSTNANDAYSGTRALNYWHDADFTFSAGQTITGLPDGLYTLRVRASGGGGDRVLRLFAEGDGGGRLTADIVNTGWNNWQAYAIENIPVTGGQITVGVEGEAPAGTWGLFDDFEFFRQVTMPVWSADAALEAAEVGTDFVRLRWSGIANPEAAVGYKIYRDGKPAATAGADANEITITGLEAGTTYTFQVEAGGEAGLWTDGGPSVTVTTGRMEPAPQEPGDEGGQQPGPSPQEPDDEGGRQPDPAPQHPQPGTGPSGPGSGGGSPAANVDGESDDAAGEHDVVTLSEEELAEPGDGPVVVEVPETTAEVRLPTGAPERLGDRPLEVRRGGLVLRVPAATLAQLAGLADSGEEPRDGAQEAKQEDSAPTAEQAGNAARAAAEARRYAQPGIPARNPGHAGVSVLAATDEGYLAVRLAPPADPDAWISRAERRTGLELKAFNRLVDLRLAHVDGRGNSRTLGTFAAPVAIGLRPETEAGFDPELTGIYRLMSDGSMRYAGGRDADGRKEAAVFRAGVYGLFEASRRYADVPDTHPAHRAIAALSARLVLTGTDAAGGRFEPDRGVTRAEFTAMLARLLDLPDDPGLPAFADVPDGAWHAPAIRAARAAGIALGGSGGRFRPNDAITREEMAVMLVRAAMHASPEAAAPGTAGTAYADDGRISAWARDAVNRVTALGLMRGLPDGRFHPNGAASRAEAARALHRLAVLLDGN